MYFSDIDSFKNLIGLQSERDDELIDELILSVSQQVISYCGRYLKQDTYFETFYTYEDIIATPLYLRETPISSIETIKLDGTTITNADYRLDKSTGRLYIVDLPGYVDQEEMVITYTGGYKFIPSDIKLAVNLQCAFLYQRRDSVGVSSISSPDGDVTTKVDFKLIPGVQEILDSYRIRKV